MKEIKSIISGNLVENYNNKIEYDKFFLDKYLDEEVELNEISDIKIIDNYLNDFFDNNYEYDTKIIFNQIYEVLKNNLDKYSMLLSIETNISLKQSKDKLKSILSYIKNAYNNFNDYKEKLIFDSIYINKKGSILISISGSDPFEGFINSFLPALFLRNKVYVKASRKSALMIYNFFQDLILIKNFNKNILNLIFCSNDLFVKLIKNKTFDYIYWTGSYNSTKYIEKICVESDIEFSYDGSGLDFLYISKNFEDWNLFEKTIINNLINLNGKNCNSIRYIFVHYEIYESIKLKLRKIIKKIEKLDLLESKLKYPIGPLSNNEIYNLNNFLDKLKFEEVIYSYKDEKNYFSPKIYFNPVIFENLFNIEIFGPVMFLKPVKNIDKVIFYQKISKFGLSFTVFSKDLNSLSIVDKLGVGRINLNCDPLDVSFFEPWGGVKLSGSQGAKNWLDKFSNKLFLKNGIRN